MLVDLLEDAFYELKVDAAPGVDRLMWKDYEAKLEAPASGIRGCRVLEGCPMRTPGLSERCVRLLRGTQFRTGALGKRSLPDELKGPRS